MPRKPTPYFQVYAAELLTDEKIEELSHEELGIVFRLWAKMWVNGVERGTLLREPETPISDQAVAQFLRVSDDRWREIEVRLVSQLKVLRRGTFGELYSKRMRNFKTKWELYGDEKESKKTRKRKIPEENRTTALASSLASAKIKEKTAPSAVECGQGVEKTKATVEKFLRTGFKCNARDPDKDRTFRDGVERVCKAFMARCQEWGDVVEDEKKAVNRIFGVVLNLMRCGVARVPKGVSNFRGFPTEEKVALELVAALSQKRPDNPLAELIDAFRKQPKYRRY